MNFLDTIISDKRAEVNARSRTTPLAVVEQHARKNAVRNFVAALSMEGTRVIAELKAHTPTIASFPASHQLEDLAPVYERNGACAISVVVDEKRFGTSLRLVTKIRHRVSLPVLVKEFVIDPYQIFEARAAGADAILLIARLLDADKLATFVDLAHNLRMTALVEVHDEFDIDRASRSGARVIGINNRDLDRMVVSLDTSRRLLPQMPEDCVRVCESGISTRADVEELALLGANAFLVGGAILSAQRPAEKLCELIGPQSRRAE